MGDTLFQGELSSDRTAGEGGGSEGLQRPLVHLLVPSISLPLPLCQLLFLLLPRPFLLLGGPPPQ